MASASTSTALRKGIFEREVSFGHKNVKNAGSSFIFLTKWANPVLFLFLFVLLNHNFTEKMLTQAGFELEFAA